MRDRSLNYWQLGQCSVLTMIHKVRNQTLLKGAQVESLLIIMHTWRTDKRRKARMDMARFVPELTALAHPSPHQQSDASNSMHRWPHCRGTFDSGSTANTSQGLIHGFASNLTILVLRLPVPDRQEYPRILLSALSPLSPLLHRKSVSFNDVRRQGDKGDVAASLVLFLA